MLLVICVLFKDDQLPFDQPVDFIWLAMCNYEISDVSRNAKFREMKTEIGVISLCDEMEKFISRNP